MSPDQPLQSLVCRGLTLLSVFLIPTQIHARCAPPAVRHWSHSHTRPYSHRLGRWSQSAPGHPPTHHGSLLRWQMFPIPSSLLASRNSTRSSSMKMYTQFSLAPWITTPSQVARLSAIENHEPERLSPMKPVMGDFEANPYFPPREQAYRQKFRWQNKLDFRVNTASQPGVIFSQHKRVAIETPPIHILYQSSGFSSTQVFLLSKINMQDLTAITKHTSLLLTSMNFFRHYPPANNDNKINRSPSFGW